MNERIKIGAISIESVARKLRSIRDLEVPEMSDAVRRQPRLLEMLRFLQHVSTEPGGLVKFVEDMTTQLPNLFGTPTQLENLDNKSGLELKRTCLEELPRHHRPEKWPEAVRGYGESDWGILGRKGPSKEDERAVNDFLKGLPLTAFQEIAISIARRELPELLPTLCAEKCKSFVFFRCWFMADPCDAVIEMMDRRAKDAASGFAITGVTEKMSDAFDYAWNKKIATRVIGNSRFGKTEYARAVCRMWPGRFRFVEVPDGNSLTALSMAIGAALGIDVSYGRRPDYLKELIEFVLQETGICLVFDEAALLLPQNYTRSSAPARLNWIRRQIMDRNLPCVFLFTPNRFDTQSEKFIKKTGYAMEQFIGRFKLTAELPDELPRKEMLAVVAVHFPDEGEGIRRMVASAATVSPSYLQAVADLAMRARWLAEKRGRNRIGVSDIDSAIEDLGLQSHGVAMPAGAQTTAPENDVEPNVKASLKAAQRAVKPARKVTPEPMEFPVSSLRGAGLERANSGLVPVEA